MKRSDKMRRVIISYDVVDERKIRYQAERSFNSPDSESLYTRVEFHPDLINEIRQYPLAIDFNLLCSLTSHVARRLFEVLNLGADSGHYDFDFDVRDLAHERLGLSRAFKAPSQCWSKIKPAFEKLTAGRYLIKYHYDKSSCRVTGTISEKHIPQHFAPMQPLPKVYNRRGVLQKRMRSIGMYENVAKGLLDICPDHILGKIDFVINYIEDAKATNSSRSYNYGGWAVNEIKYLRDHGEINPSLIKTIETDTRTDSEECGTVADELNIVRADDDPPHIEPDETIEVAERLWEQVISRCAKFNIQQVIETWFRPVKAVRLEGRQLVLLAPNQVVADWIESNYREPILSALSEVTGEKEEWTFLFLASPDKEH